MSRGAPKPPVLCECGKTISYYNLKVHQRSACAAKGNAKPPKPCMCGCGTMVESSAGREKNFVDQKHYDKWRTANRALRLDAYEAAGKPPEVRQAEEMRPLCMSEETIAAEAERLGAVILANRESSFSRWLDLLGVKREAA